MLERSASVPTWVRARSSSTAGAARRDRAGVSGTAWASIWLPAIVQGRADEQIRVAPVSHAGELLGLSSWKGRDGERILRGR